MPDILMCALRVWVVFGEGPPGCMGRALKVILLGASPERKVLDGDRSTAYIFLIFAVNVL